VFVEDLAVSGLCRCTVLRAPEAGSLLSPEWPHLGEGYTLITAAHIPGKNRLDGMEVPVLAEKGAAYAGEAAALLVGPDKSKIAEYASLFKWVYGEKPAERVFTERAFHTKTPNKSEKTHGNCITITGMYSTGAQYQWPVEPAGALSFWDGDTLVVKTASQWSSHVKESVRAVTGLDADRVRVENVPQRGVTFDAKVWFPSLVCCQAALAAFITKKPVKIVLSREEDYHYSALRAPAKIRFKSVLPREGKSVSTDIDASLSLGAYGVFVDEMTERLLLAAMGIYGLGSLSLHAASISSPMPPAGPFAGFSLAQGFFAIETHISRLAAASGCDGIEWRGNALRNAPHSHLPERLAKRADAVLNDLSLRSDYKRKWAAYDLQRRGGGGEPMRGIGIALAWQGSGFLFPPRTGGKQCALSVTVTLKTDGTLEASCPLDMRTGHIEIWKELAADILSMDKDKVSFQTAVHTNTPLPPATLSARITQVTGLLTASCEAVRDQRFKAKLPISVTKTYTPNLVESIFGTKVDEASLKNLSLAAAAVEVEIDNVRWAPRIRGLWLSVDAGHIHAESDVRQALTSSAMAALGWASGEKCGEGRSCRDYVTGGSEDISLLNANFVSAPVDDNAPQSKSAVGIKELPFCVFPSAYIQAVSQAANREFFSIPLDTSFWASSEGRRGIR